MLDTRLSGLTTANQPAKLTTQNMLSRPGALFVMGAADDAERASTAKKDGILPHARRRSSETMKGSGCNTA
jgi:hypothetical protein